ncbi:MAG: MFS transporter [Patescibacteria group bacterium]
MKIKMFYKFIKNNRSFLFLWLAQIFSQLSISILNFVLAISIYTETKSNFAVSILLVAYGLPAFLFSIVSGVFVDRFDRKKTMAFVNLSRAFFLFVFLFFPSNILSITILLAFIMSALTQFFFPAEGATIPNIVKKKDLILANSLYTTTYFISQVLGYLFAGPLFKAVSYKGVLFILFVLFFLAALFIWIMGGKTFTILDLWRGFVNKLKPKRTIIGDVKKDLNSAWVYLKSVPALLNVLIILGVSQIVTYMFVSLMPGFGFEVLGIETSDVSLYLMGPAVLGVGVGAFVVHKLSKKFNSDNLINIGILGSGTVFLILSFIRRVPLKTVKYSLGFLRFAPLQRFFPHEFTKLLGVDVILFALILVFFIGVFSSFIIVASNAKMQRHCADNMRGKMYGLLQTIVTAGALLPLLLGGLLADKFGVLKIIGVSGILIVFVGIIKVGKNLKTKCIPI